jgi:hypothetical protein
MDIGDWVWLLGAFWCGALASVLALSLMKAGQKADASRYGRTPAHAMMTDLESDTASPI